MVCAKIKDINNNASTLNVSKRKSKGNVLLLAFYDKCCDRYNKARTFSEK